MRDSYDGPFRIIASPKIFPAPTHNKAKLGEGNSLGKFAVIDGEHVPKILGITPSLNYNLSPVFVPSPKASLPYSFRSCLSSAGSKPKVALLCVMSYVMSVVGPIWLLDVDSDSIISPELMSPLSSFTFR